MNDRNQGSTKKVHNEPLFVQGVGVGDQMKNAHGNSAGNTFHLGREIIFISTRLFWRKSFGLRYLFLSLSSF